MRGLATVARWEALVFLAGCFVVLAWKFMRGRNPFHQLLSGDRADGTVYLSSGRIQLLLVTTVFSVQYVRQLFHATGVFPHLWAGYLWALAGSQALYLLGKTHAIIFNSSIFHRTKGDPERRDS